MRLISYAIAALTLGVVAGCSSIQEPGGATKVPPAELGLGGVEQLLSDARRSLVHGDYVKALLCYDEAVELECLISGGLGETSISPYEAGLFVERLLNTPDGALMQILQSDQICTDRKKCLLRNLEEKIEKKHFPDHPHPIIADDRVNPPPQK
jgi:hypothetical protein